MNRQHATPTVIALSLVISLVSPLRATDEERLHKSWSLTPETDRAHTTEAILALPVFRKLTVVWCELEYSHGRRRSEGYGTGNIEIENLNLPKGGKLEVAFEIVTKTGTTQLDQRTAKVKKEDRRRSAWLGWVDSSGLDNGDNRYKYKPMADFPLQLKKGDVLLFAVRFSGMPRLLGVETTATTLQRDNIYMSAHCTTCGSDGIPCPEI